MFKLCIYILGYVLYIWDINCLWMCYETIIWIMDSLCVNYVLYSWIMCKKWILLSYYIHNLKNHWTIMDCSCHIHEICWSVYGLITTSEFQIWSDYHNCSWFMNWFCFLVFIVMTDFVFLFSQLLTIFVLVMLFWSWLCTNYDKHCSYKFIIQSKSNGVFLWLSPIQFR
jgi:hypothetical protein